MINLEHTVTIAGQAVQLRFIRKEDVLLLVNLYYQLSERTIWLLFQWREDQWSRAEIWNMAHSLSASDTARQAVVIATVVQDEQEQIIGVARLSRSNPDNTEARAALVIRDDFQNRGLGKRVMRMLAQQGRRMGITHVIGVVMPENVYTMKMLRRLGYTVESSTEYGECRVRFRI